MKPTLTSWGPATVIVVGLVLIGAVAGAIVTIVQPATLAFPQFLDDLAKFAGAVGVLGIGRGLYMRGPGGPR